MTDIQDKPNLKNSMRTFNVGDQGAIEPSSPHAWIHRGRSYVASVNRTTASADVFDVVVQAGADQSVHAFSEITFFENCRIQFFKNPTHTGGTTIVPTNRNLASTGVPEFRLIGEPTVTDPGIEIYPDATLPGGNGNFASGGTAGGNLERIIPGGVSVLVRMTPLSGAQVMSYTVEGYEPGRD